MKQWRLALRSLLRRPGFALAAAGLLTLGVGANTALFSLVYTVLVKPLPYPDSGQLVTVYEASSARNQRASLIAPARLADWNRLNRTFTAIAGIYSETVTNLSGSEPRRLTGMRVSPGYFAVYGMAPLVGRTFTAGEEQFGGPLAAVISYRLWTRTYGKDPAVTSRRLVIGGKECRIAGVMPEAFTSSAVDLWMPAQTPPFVFQARDARFYSGVGRVKPGVGMQKAEADLVAVQQALGEQYPTTDKGWSVVLQDLKEARVGTSGKPLVVLFGAVGLLLLITVTNVAGLVLAQYSERGRELSIRAALGANRTQVVVCLLREVVWIALAGAVGGFAAAVCSMRLLLRLFADLPRAAELHMDWGAFAFATAVSLTAMLAFGLLPALRATDPQQVAPLIRAGRGTMGPRQRAQNILVGGQIALTLLLLAGAGLLLRSFQNLSRVELGFDPAHTIVFHVGAAWDEDRTRIGRLQERLLAEIGRLPGVEAAGITNFLPASGATLRYQVLLEGAGKLDDTGKMPVGERTVSPGYLRALRVPLTAGAWCPELRTDFNAAPKVMVNRRFVEVYAGGENVVGRHLHWVGMTSGGAQPGAEIVGVIGDMKEDAVGAPAYPYVYACATGGGWPDPEYTVRVAGDPHGWWSSIRQIVHNADPGRAVFGTGTLEDSIDRTLDRPRANATMLALFAIAAMVLAAAGLYGLVAQLVNARRQEIGVRIALGAQPGEIVRWVVAGAGRVVTTGMAAGFALTLLARPLVRSLIYGVSPLDTASLVAAVVVLGLVSVLAACLPARSAAAIDPMESMRAE